MPAAALTETDPHGGARMGFIFIYLFLLLKFSLGLVSVLHFPTINHSGSVESAAVRYARNMKNSDAKWNLVVPGVQK